MHPGNDADLKPLPEICGQGNLLWLNVFILFCGFGVFSAGGAILYTTGLAVVNTATLMFMALYCAVILLGLFVVALALTLARCCLPQESSKPNQHTARTSGETASI